jgi:hypothetical protein
MADNLVCWNSGGSASTMLTAASSCAAMEQAAILDSAA